MRFLFLYTEVAEYFLACCRNLAKQAEVHIVHWPVAAEAPFDLNGETTLNLYQRDQMDLQAITALIETIQPSALFISGWVDRDYLTAAKTVGKRFPVVLIMDNHWVSSPKQHFARMVFPFTLGRFFSHAWVPGNHQKEYALKLGFKKSNIKKSIICGIIMKTPKKKYPFITNIIPIIDPILKEPILPSNMHAGYLL